jgi:hypothetical protein
MTESPINGNDEVVIERPASEPDREPVPAASTAPMQRGRPFQPGQSGNPAGRPKGSRNRLTDLVMRALVDDFEEHGGAAIARVRQGDPVAYLKLIASLLPKEMVLEREGEPDVDYDNISLEEYIELIELLRRRSRMKDELLLAGR